MHVNCGLQCNESLLLLGKSIAFHQHRDISNKSSINSSRSDIHGNPMRHSKRIKQLFLPVRSLYEVKHEIANHYRDTKNKNAAKVRTKAKRSLAALYRQRKKSKFSRLISTAFMHRRKRARRRRFFSHREVLQIPAFTFPRYELDVGPSMEGRHCCSLIFLLEIVSNQLKLHGSTTLLLYFVVYPSVGVKLIFTSHLFWCDSIIKKKPYTQSTHPRNRIHLIL